MEIRSGVIIHTVVLFIYSEYIQSGLFMITRVPYHPLVPHLYACLGFASCMNFGIISCSSRKNPSDNMCRRRKKSCCCHRAWKMYPKNLRASSAFFVCVRASAAGRIKKERDFFFLEDVFFFFTFCVVVRVRRVRSAVSVPCGKLPQLLIARLCLLIVICFVFVFVLLFFRFFFARNICKKCDNFDT